MSRWSSCNPPTRLAHSPRQVDAWAIWDPYTAQAEADSPVRSIAEAAGVTNGAGFGVASDEALADPKRNTALSDLLVRYAKAVRWAKDNPDRWARSYAAAVGLDRQGRDRIAGAQPAVADRAVRRVGRLGTEARRPVRRVQADRIGARSSPTGSTAATTMRSNPLLIEPQLGAIGYARANSSGSCPPTATAARSSVRRTRRRITRCPPTTAHRPVGYLAEVARAADRLGFEGVLTPTGTWCEDAWLTASALLAETERLKFLVAFRPGLVPPTLAAQQTATLQRFSEGRVLLNIVTGGDDVEQRRFGDWLDHDERYARTGEFLHIVELGVARGVAGLRGRVLPRRGRAGIRAAGSVAADLFRRIVAGRAADRRRARRRVPDLGRAAAGRGAPRSSGCANSPKRVAATCGSASGCTPSAATRPLPRGRSPTNCSPSCHREQIAKAD